MTSNKENLNYILQSFKIKAECVNYAKIRNMSLYDLRLEPGTRVKDIQKFSNEISLSLKAKAAPLVKIITALGVVRLEIIEEDPHMISFLEEYNKMPPLLGEIPMYFGSSVSGEDLLVDIAKHPHTIIAGTTGSGKSTLLHVIVANALKLANIKLCLIDTKNVEFKDYENFKNVELATDYTSSVKMLTFLHKEMEYRYHMMNSGKNRKNFTNILFVIDEFADLIMQDASQAFYTMLCKLAQKSRAAGIYCILATQRPSADILRGTIKANFPARISCHVASHTDSKIVLDSVGAELLGGRGDAIIKNYNNNYQRFQIAFTTPEEVSKFYANR